MKTLDMIYKYIQEIPNYNKVYLIKIKLVVVWRALNLKIDGNWKFDIRLRILIIKRN